MQLDAFARCCLESYSDCCLDQIQGCWAGMGLPGRVGEGKGIVDVNHMKNMPRVGWTVCWLFYWELKGFCIGPNLARGMTTTPSTAIPSIPTQRQYEITDHTILHIPVNGTTLVLLEPTICLPIYPLRCTRFYGHLNSMSLCRASACAWARPPLDVCLCDCDQELCFHDLGWFGNYHSD